MIKTNGGISMRTAALIGGLPVMLLTAPFGEFYVFGSLVDYKDAARTTQNIMDHPKLFMSGVFAMLVTFIYDIVLAWACYIFIRPVNAMVALLSAWTRLIYTGIAIVALFNFVDAFHVVNLPGMDEVYRQQQVLQLINARESGMHLAYIVFGFYLILGGVLICKSTYIPTVLGILIMLAGAAWMLMSLQPYFFKSYDFSWLIYFSVGELFFGFWLLFKGTKIRESEIVELKVAI